MRYLNPAQKSKLIESLNNLAEIELQIRPQVYFRPSMTICHLMSEKLKKLAEKVSKWIENHEFLELNTSSVIILMSSTIRNQRKIDLINLMMKWIEKKEPEDPVLNTILQSVNLNLSFERLFLTRLAIHSYHKNRDVFRNFDIFLNQSGFLNAFGNWQDGQQQEYDQLMSRISENWPNLRIISRKQTTRNIQLAGTIQDNLLFRIRFDQENSKEKLDDWKPSGFQQERFSYASSETCNRSRCPRNRNEHRKNSKYVPSSSDSSGFYSSPSTNGKRPPRGGFKVIPVGFPPVIPNSAKPIESSVAQLNIGRFERKPVSFEL